MDLYGLEEIAMQYCEALHSCQVTVYSPTDVTEEEVLPASSLSHNLGSAVTRGMNCAKCDNSDTVMDSTEYKCKQHPILIMTMFFPLLESVRNHSKSIHKHRYALLSILRSIDKMRK